MIDKVVKHIVAELNFYFDPALQDSNKLVEAGSLFNAKGEATSITNKLLVSIVNIREDPHYHSLEIYKKNDEGKNQLIKPEIKLNVYFLLAATHTEYNQALKAVSRAIAFFQHRKSFDIFAGDDSISAVTNHVVFEMESLSFEQQNNVWGMLGGKYQPSVMYKAGIIDIRDERVEGIVSSVKEIGING